MQHTNDIHTVQWRYVHTLKAGDFILSFSWLNHTKLFRFQKVCLQYFSLLSRFPSRQVKALVTPPNDRSLSWTFRNTHNNQGRINKYTFKWIVKPKITWDQNGFTFLINIIYLAQFTRTNYSKEKYRLFS